MAIEDVYIRLGGALESSARARFFAHTGSTSMGAVEPADIVQTVFLEMLEPHFRLPSNDEITELIIRKYLGYRAKDAIRDRDNHHISLDGIASEDGADWHDFPVPARVLQETALSHRSSEDEYFARASDDRPSDALDAINAAHSEIDNKFTAAARDRVAKCQKRALRERFRPLVIEVLLCRRSVLATLLHTGRRDTYSGADAEAKVIALQTGLTIGGARNLRTGVIKALRAELQEEIQTAVQKLVKVWKVTPEQAVELHLRWAEQGGFS